MEFESHLRDSVLEQAHENGRQLLADAKESIEREAKEQEARLKQEKLQQREQEIKAINRQVQREVQQLENEKRQSTLATKQGILKELFAGAYKQMAVWSVEQEQAFLEQVLKKYPQEELILTVGSRTLAKYSAGQLERLLEHYPHVKLASSSVSGEAVFLLSRGNIDDNYLYRNLVDSLWQEESYQLAQKIFQDEAD